MTELGNTTQKLKMLREMGVGVDIDDFGTVYSSLAYLRRLPVDKLKIDRTFIQDLNLHSEDHVDPAALIKAIVTLGHSLRMTVLAEGVETENQLNQLRDLGCDQAQGFYFSRAVPPDQVWDTILRINRMFTSEDE